MSIARTAFNHNGILLLAGASYPAHARLVGQLIEYLVFGWHHRDGLYARLARMPNVLLATLYRQPTPPPAGKQALMTGIAVAGPPHESL